MKSSWKERTYCGDIKIKDLGKRVHLMGWVDAIRDHGQVLFIHLRDIRGIIQVVYNKEKQVECYQTATQLKEEFVIETIGVVRKREKGTENPNIETGNLEVIGSELNILSQSKPLPFHLSEKAMVFGQELKVNLENVDEDLRLKYRFLDLRRPTMQDYFLKRYQITRCVRDYLYTKNFVELETPVLTKSTPEGARDYLVPSRLHEGKFYALPQSPQLFKQLLMISGMDRYFQIVKCFRDEDLRPNRQPEFTQLDMEASFIDEEFIYEVLEELTVKMFQVGDIKLPRPFPRISYNDAMNQYGSDRPDLRFDMNFVDITHLFPNTSYSIFKKILAEDGCVKGFCVNDQKKVLSKNILQNEYALKIVPGWGAKGMSWMRLVKGKLESNIVQFFSEEEQTNIIKSFNAKDGDVILMIADKSIDIVNEVLGKLRLNLAEKLDMIPEDRFEPVWITDFPLFEYDGEKISSTHHPFTMPDRLDFDPQNKKELLALKSRAYDLVVNGEELGGGSIRIHRMDIQQKIFQALGLAEVEIENKFGFFLRALEYGAPPHGGIALGLDRVVAMILGVSSIRDVIAFPKNRSAVCPLTDAPSSVDKKQLDELHLKTGKFYIIDKGETKRKEIEEEITDKEGEDIISEAEVRHIAQLARLSLNEDEIALFRKDLNSILHYVEVLNEVDTQDISPTSHILLEKNVWREDIPQKSNKSEEIFINAPQKQNAYFKVPKILEEM